MTQNPDRDADPGLLAEALAALRALTAVCETADALWDDDGYGGDR